MFYSDKTQDITSVEQLALHVTFILKGKVKEDPIDLITISKVVISHLCAVNIISTLESGRNSLVYCKYYVRPGKVF